MKHLAIQYDDPDFDALMLGANLDLAKVKQIVDGSPSSTVTIYVNQPDYAPDDALGMVTVHRVL